MLEKACILLHGFGLAWKLTSLIAMVDQVFLKGSLVLSVMAVLIIALTEATPAPSQQRYVRPSKRRMRRLLLRTE